MDEEGHELKVTFIPQLYLQRRIWILDTLRQERVVDVLDVGCGEGQLLSALCQPASWLAFNPRSTDGRQVDGSDVETVVGDDETAPMNLFNSSNGLIPFLHIKRVAGLDISDVDLDFAVKVTEPEPSEPVGTGSSAEVGPGTRTGLGWGFGIGLGGREPVRWEPMTASIWKGGLEVVNEEFVGVECIVASEVIEHLTPDVFPLFAPVLLGIYQPRLLLITTPSYTFNARFTAPDAPSNRKSGYPDPTGRTDRVFRHEDHKFEWTPEEFRIWCEEETKKWGYEVKLGDIGRAYEVDGWGRDEELGGATLVATFRRRDNGVVAERQTQAREAVRVLRQERQQRMNASEEARGESEAEEREELKHELLVSHLHLAHERARKPLLLSEIRDIVKDRMEEYRESFMRLEDLWYERDVSIACGGQIEVLIKSLQEPNDILTLKQEGDATGLNVQRQRELWKVELLGDPTVKRTRMLWPSTEESMDEHERSIEYMPSDWNPEEEYKSEYDDPAYLTASSSGGDGDVSWNEDEPEETAWVTGSTRWNPEAGSSTADTWGANVESGGWDEELDKRTKFTRLPSNASSTTGWDGDESDDTTS
ncbi:hypothetical protein L218DRAFT_654877 [Marasmius fiardii PR-910]|nr:hypothetical protein L218DRAFT_654877 [Marasmius fiardii PR-910]